MNQETENSLLEFLEAIGRSVEPLTEQAWNRLVAMSFAESVAELVIALVFLVLAIIMAFLAKRAVKSFRDALKADEYGSEAQIKFFLTVGCVSPCMILTIMALSYLVNKWMWIGLFAPEVRAFAKIFHSIS